MKRITAAILAIVLLAALTGCGKDASDGEGEPVTNGYRAMMASKQKEDGWYLTFIYNYVPDENGNRTNPNFFFDGINLKYDYLPDFQIRLTDGSTGEVLDYIEPDLSNICQNPEYKVILDAINSYLLSRPLTPDLTVAELDFFEDNSLFTRQDVVELYNEAIANGEWTRGEFDCISSAGQQEDGMMSGYQWRVSYMMMYSNLSLLNIELIYEDGRYLSDIPEEELTAGQRELRAAIDGVEKSMVGQQDFLGIGIDPNTVIDNVEFSRLYRLLEAFDAENRAAESAEAAAR